MHLLVSRPALVLLGVLTTPVLAPVSHLFADDNAEKSAPKKTVEVGGVLEAVRVKEIKANTEQLSPLKIKRYLDHGSVVSRGQTLVWFETEPVEKKIKEAKIALRLSRMSLEAAEFAHKQAVANEKIERGKADRTIRQARQRHKNFMSVDRDRQVATAEFEVKKARAALENATEELEQLEQMYKEDDLTEESEEIVLKRAQQAVEIAQFRLEGVEISAERSITQSLPNTVANQEDALVVAEMAHKKALRDFAAAGERRKIEFNKTREGFREDEKKFEELQQERERVMLTSPIDGIVLHGRLTRGRLGDKPSQLAKGSTVAGNQVVMTVVDPRRLQVRVDLSEAHLATVHEGDTCTICFPSMPELMLKGEVSSVALVPYASTKYDCVVKLRGIPKSAGLKPLMTCKLSFEIEHTGTEAKEEAAD